MIIIKNELFLFLIYHMIWKWSWKKKYLISKKNLSKIYEYRYHEKFHLNSWFLIQENCIKWKWILCSRIENHRMIIFEYLGDIWSEPFCLKDAKKENDRIKFFEIWSKNILQNRYDWNLNENDSISRKYMNICFFPIIRSHNFFTQIYIKYDP